MKLCKKCLEEKELTDFYKHKDMADGLLSFCKSCTKNRIKIFRKENLLKLRCYDRKRYVDKKRFQYKFKCLACGKDFTSSNSYQKCCSLSCANSSERNPGWKGGKYRSYHGYVMVRSPHHPFSKRGYVQEHRLVMEKKLKRFLNPEEDVHHINGIKDDNRIINLKKCSRSEHMKLHHPKGKQAHK